jgi:hypothetical protein
MTNDLIANRYSTGALIGQGGMVDVYLGRDVQSGQPVAIKLLKADLGPVAEAASGSSARARRCARWSIRISSGCWQWIGWRAGAAW